MNIVNTVELKDPYISIIAYRPNFVWAGKKGNGVYLQPFSGDYQKHFEYLYGFAGLQRGKFADYSKSLIPLYQAIYEEAKNIARTKEDQRAVSNLLRELEEMQLGKERAWNNWSMREETLK